MSEERRMLVSCPKCALVFGVPIGHRQRGAANTLIGELNTINAERCKRIEELKAENEMLTEQNKKLKFLALCDHPTGYSCHRCHVQMSPETNCREIMPGVIVCMTCYGEWGSK